MSDNVIVSNSPTSINPDLPVRTIDKSGEQVQVMAIDVGNGITESLVSTINPLPVAGTFTVDPAGLATEAKQTTGNASLTSIDGKITVCNTGAVTISAALPAGTSNIGLVSAVQSGTWNLTNISGTVSLPTGAATETTLSTLNGKVTACNTGAVTISAALPAGANNIGDVDVASLPSVVAATYSTSSVTSVVSAAVSTSILVNNANRRMAILFNDCDKAAYVKLGATASTTSFSYKLSPAQTLELPIPLYTGAIDAIWDATPTGSMRVTEVS